MFPSSSPRKGKLKSLPTLGVRMRRVVSKNRWKRGRSVAREPAIIPRPASIADHTITGVDVAGLHQWCEEGL
jgi:hypothetical protein